MMHEVLQQAILNNRYRSTYKRMSFYIEDDHVALLDEVAKKTGITKSKLVRLALYGLFELYEQNKL